MFDYCVSWVLFSLFIFHVIDLWKKPSSWCSWMFYIPHLYDYFLASGICPSIPIFPVNLCHSVCFLHIFSLLYGSFTERHLSQWCLFLSELISVGFCISFNRHQLWKVIHILVVSLRLEWYNVGFQDLSTGVK